MGFQPNELDPGRSARDQFGWEMRAHRDRARMSLDQLAKIVNISKGHLGRVERAESMPPPDLPRMLDAAFGTDGRFDRVYQLAKNEKFPGKYRQAIQIEGQAAIIEEYAAAAIPGLLQIPSFARCSLRAGQQHATEEEINALLVARLERQKRLDSTTPPRCWFILDEATLRRPVGGLHVMCEQLAALSAEKRSFITLQVLPFAAGEHPEMGGSLMLYTLPAGGEIAWAEGAKNGEVIDEMPRVAERRESYDLLRAQALSPRDSRAMIRLILKEYGRASRNAGEVAQE
ncbi:Scr1 family TA system antitoxin-like transcriptional regulator [Kitasatospora sp. NPDC087861]|uniref:helix-turn-helix domain-containing protein n=1 Tax=Kitasatospora sp. NPDC087861 TaxID=3364070 RepID=UPI00380C3584